MHWYLMVRHSDPKRNEPEVVGVNYIPTGKDYGKVYGFAEGPFESRRACEIAKERDYFNNPMLTVETCNRLARLEEK